METQKVIFSCDSCGRQIDLRLGDFHDVASPDWITLSYWEGMGAIAHYNFCSNGCLKAWLDRLPTPVPQVFMSSFERE